MWIELFIIVRYSCVKRDEKCLGRCFDIYPLGCENNLLLGAIFKINWNSQWIWSINFVNNCERNEFWDDLAAVIHVCNAFLLQPVIVMSSCSKVKDPPLRHEKYGQKQGPELLFAFEGHLVTVVLDKSEVTLRETKTCDDLVVHVISWSLISFISFRFSI